jgi:cysteine-rich repeat protein
MKLGSFLISVGVALGTFIVAQGCSIFAGDTNANEDRLCTPGAYVFCRCADKAPGTKLCQTDGRSFAICQTNSTGECVGGEIPDQRTGKELKPEELPPEAKDPPNAINSCPGRSLSPTPNVEMKLEGDTSTANGDRKGEGSCASGDGAKDQVYHVIPSGSGRLQVKVTGAEGALSPVVYLRTSCDDVASQAACGPSEPKATAQLATNVRTGKDYYLFIDGSSASAGKYTATVKLTTSSFCGDGVVDKDEACDDGNHTDDDGCGPNCGTVNGNPPSGASCPGQPVHVWSNVKVTGKGSTTAPSYGNAWNAPNKTCDVGTNSYQDHIYAVTPHATGNLTVSLTPPAQGTFPNLMITARRTCETPEANPLAMCANDKGSSSDGLETFTFAVEQDKTVFVAIDGGGITNNAGDYVVNFELQPQ